jgi:hypothetical protein
MALPGGKGLLAVIYREGPDSRAPVARHKVSDHCMDLTA